jgi:hypothetical protein
MTQPVVDTAALFPAPALFTDPAALLSGLGGYVALVLLAAFAVRMLITLLASRL